MMDTLFDVMVTPLKGLDRVTQERPVGWALLVTVIAWAIVVTTFILDMGEVLFGIGREWSSVVLLLFALFFCIVTVLIYLMASSGVTHIIAVTLRGQGGYLGMVCGRSFATLPLIFFAPLAVLHVFLSFPGSLVYYFGVTLLFLWVLVLDVIAVRQNYHFSTMRAVAAYLIFAAVLTCLLVVPALVVAVISFFA